MKVTMRRLLLPSLSLLISATVAMMATASAVFASNYEVGFTKADGVAGVKDAQVTAKITQDGKAAVGVKGSFSFGDAKGDCTTLNTSSDSEGLIKGTCKTLVVSQHTITFTLEGRSPENIYVNFTREEPETSSSSTTQDSAATDSTPTPTPTSSPSLSSSPSPSPASTPSPKPRVSILPTPTPSVSPSPTPKVSPKITPRPSATSSARPSPSPALDEEEGESQTEAVLTTDISSPQPSPSPDAERAVERDDKENDSFDPTWVLLIGGVVLGLGIPSGWFVLESNPSLKAKLVSWLHKMQRKQK